MPRACGASSTPRLLRIREPSMRTTPPAGRYVRFPPQPIGRGWRFSNEVGDRRFGYLRKRLCWEQQVINLWLSATCAVLIPASGGLMLLQILAVAFVPNL